MTDKEKSELQKVLKAMPLADLTITKQLLSHELDQRQGKSKFQPERWAPHLSTRG